MSFKKSWREREEIVAQIGEAKGNIVRLTLPEPPSANRYWRSYRGRLVISPAAIAYKGEVATRCIIAKVKPLPLSANVRLTVRWFRSKRMGDLDNRLKIIFDALNGYVYHDDAQIVEIHAYREDDKTRPRLELTVEAA